MAYWLTTHWPSRADDPYSLRQHIYLQNGKEHVADLMKLNDLVFIYEYKTGPVEVVRRDGREHEIPCVTGRQGIVTFAKVAGYPKDRGIGPTKYKGGGEMWWRWCIATKHVANGFVPLAEVNRILGYASGSVLRAFGDANSGLKKLSDEQGAAFERAFFAKDNRPIPAAIRPPRTQSGEGRGIESQAHLDLKEYVAECAEQIFNEPGLRKLGVGIEHPFATQDSADVALQDRFNRVIGVEVELDQGDEQIEGLLQAVKYRYLLAVSYRKRVEESRSVLVAYKLAKQLKELAKVYDVECFEVPRQAVAKWKASRSGK